MVIWQVQVWSISKQRWETFCTTGSRDKALEAWNRLNNDGLTPRMVKL